MPEIQANVKTVKQDDSKLIEEKDDKLTQENLNQSQQHTTEVVVVEKSCGKSGGVSNSDKWIIAIIIGIIVFILFSPFFFKLTNYIFRGFGLPTCRPDGKPTIA